MKAPPLLNHAVYPEESIGIYLFGSSLYSDAPNDLDLAIIYKEELVNHETLILLQKDVAHCCALLIDLPIHLLVLSEAEEEEVAFLVKSGAEPVVHL